MFYKIEIQDHIRVPPDLFGKPASEAVLTMVKKEYEGLQEKLTRTIDHEQKIIIYNAAKEIKMHYDGLKRDIDLSKELLKDFFAIKDIKSLADFKKYIKTCDLILIR